MLHVFGGIDGNTIGLGSLSAALVAALGYMLRDRRDSDTRVDRANTIIIETITAERDRKQRELDFERAARAKDREEYEARINRLIEERDAYREDVIQLRVQKGQP